MTRFPSWISSETAWFSQADLRQLHSPEECEVEADYCSIQKPLHCVKRGVTSPSGSKQEGDQISPEAAFLSQMERTLFRGILENEVQAQEPSVEGEGPARPGPASHGWAGPWHRNAGSEVFPEGTGPVTLPRAGPRSGRASVGQEAAGSSDGCILERK